MIKGVLVTAACVLCGVLIAEAWLAWDAGEIGVENAILGLLLWYIINEDTRRRTRHYD